MEPIRTGIDPAAFARALSTPEEPLAPTKPVAPVASEPEEPPRTSVMSLKDSPSAAMFRTRRDPNGTGAQGAPNAERQRVDPGIKSSEETIACKVVLGATAAFVAGLATPATLGTAGGAALGKAVFGGVGAAGVLTVCESPPRPNDQGAGGAPGAR